MTVYSPPDIYGGELKYQTFWGDRKREGRTIK